MTVLYILLSNLDNRDINNLMFYYLLYKKDEQ